MDITDLKFEGSEYFAFKRLETALGKHRSLLNLSADDLAEQERTAAACRVFMEAKQQHMRFSAGFDDALFEASYGTLPQDFAFDVVKPVEEVILREVQRVSARAVARAEHNKKVEAGPTPPTYKLGKHATLAINWCGFRGHTWLLDVEANRWVCKTCYGTLWVSQLDSYRSYPHAFQRELGGYGRYSFTLGKIPRVTF